MPQSPRHSRASRYSIAHPRKKGKPVLVFLYFLFSFSSVCSFFINDLPDCSAFFVAIRPYQRKKFTKYPPKTRWIFRRECAILEPKMLSDMACKAGNAPHISPKNAFDARFGKRGFYETKRIYRGNGAVARLRLAFCLSYRLCAARGGKQSSVSRRGRGTAKRWMRRTFFGNCK